MKIAHHEHLSLIEVTDKLILDEILLDSQASQAIMLRLSDTVAAVEPAKLTALQNRLKKLSITPKIRD